MAGYPFELPPRMMDAMRAEDAREARQFELEQLERQDRAWTAARMNQAAENAFQYQTGHSSAEYREAMGRIALARENRDVTAEYGSATRAAIFVDGRELRPREEASGPVTVHADSPQAQLARARNVDPDGFMARMVEEFDRRQEAIRSAERAIEYARAEAAYHRGEISR